MKLSAIFTFMLSAVVLTASADNKATTVTGYTYLAIEMVNGTAQTLTADGLKLSYGTNVLTAENGDEKVTVALSAISRMYFTNTIATDDIGTTTGISDTKINGEMLNDKLGEVYDMQGRRVNSELKTHNSKLNKGVYIIRENGNTKKKQVK